MTCNEILEWVSAECDGAAGAEERRAIETHLAGCPACATAAREMRAAVEAVRGLPPEPAPVDMAARVAHALGRERQQEVAPPISRFRLVTRRVGPIAMAAAAVLIVALLNVNIFIAQSLKAPASGRLQREEERPVAMRPDDLELDDRGRPAGSGEHDLGLLVVENRSESEISRLRKNKESFREQAPQDLTVRRALEELERGKSMGLSLLPVSHEYAHAAPRPADAMHRVSSLLGDLQAQYEVSKLPDGSYMFDVTLDADEGGQLPVYLANLRIGDATAYGVGVEEKRRGLRLEKAAGARPAKESEAPATRDALESEGLGALPEGGISHTGGAIAVGGGWSMESSSDRYGGRLRALDEAEADRRGEIEKKGAITDAGGIGGGGGAGSSSAPAGDERPLAEGKSDSKASQGQSAAPGQAGADDKGYAGKLPDSDAPAAGAENGEEPGTGLAFGEVEEALKDQDAGKDGARKLKIEIAGEAGLAQAPPSPPGAPPPAGASAPSESSSGSTFVPPTEPPASADPAATPAVDLSATRRTPAKVPPRVRVRIRIVPK